MLEKREDESPTETTRACYSIQIAGLFKKLSGYHSFHATHSVKRDNNINRHVIRSAYILKL